MQCDGMFYRYVMDVVTEEAGALQSVGYDAA